ncbi:BTB/POZ domain-containing protein At5g48130-like [Phragmites australis]|uniref:BTB/POZ domain-containing protein At5g48130-like n=1 Tax=Phragmites australis TaxID=29695 RepID=UPI002D780FDE|nr:BTB/POZ domain-containing protein At5g48130-like [Phragmites australis]
MKLLMEMDMETEVELSPVAKAEAAVFSPYSSPSTALLLQRRVVAWAKETGSPATVRVRGGERSFELHKDPLVARCRYFSQALLQSGDVELPASFPGGCEAFEVIALFCYGDAVPLDPFNVAAVRCAAEFLDVGGLGARCDLYINQVVLQSWDDALIVLQRCQPLLPVAEELLIVSRCVESLAFMACMEILDPEQRRDQPGAAASHALVGRRWDAELVKELAARDLWIKDLIALPFEFFKRIVQALRRQGMKEKYVSPVVLFYANKWVLSKKTHKFWASTDDAVDGETDANRRATRILESVISLLPVEAAASNAIPVAFYFALLSRSLALELSDESRTRLRDQVASNLQFARVDDLLLPEEEIDQSIADSREVKAVESIVSNHVTMQRQGVEAVAELWDRYLVQIAGDTKLRPERLAELIGVIPAGERKTHNHLYEAINTYFMEHRGLSGEEKAALCRHLDCRKLSHEACIQAVQNDRMPLRLIVQALFVQQLHTHRAFTECSDSFRCMHSGELVPGAGAYTPSLGCPAIPSSQPLSTSSPYEDAHDIHAPRDASDYETASFRIQALEQEILSLKQTLQRHNTLKGSARRDGKEPSSKVTADAATSGASVRRRAAVSGSCIGSMRWGSQRRCASRILRVFARLAVFGRGRSRGK